MDNNEVNEKTVEGIITGTSLSPEAKAELLKQLSEANGDNHKIAAVHTRCLNLAGGATKAFTGKLPTVSHTK